MQSIARRVATYDLPMGPLMARMPKWQALVEEAVARLDAESPDECSICGTYITKGQYCSECRMFQRRLARS